MASSSSYPFVLHTTPPLGRLPGSDVESIYLTALFQLAAPSRFALQTADWGDNGGSIPYVSHLDHRIRIRHLQSIPAFQDPNEDLSEEEKADVLAWTAYIEQNLTDLVNHSLYSLPPNYPHFAQAQSSGLAFPQSHYIPQRIRAIHKARLDHVGLWGLGGLNAGDAADEDRKRLDDNFVSGPGGTLAPRAWSGWRSGREYAERKKQWGEEELRTRVRGVLDPLARRWKSGHLVGSSTTTADLRLYAHLAIFLAPLPNPLVGDLIRSTYPVLVQLHDRIQAQLPEPARIGPPIKTSSWWDSLPFGSSSSPAQPVKTKTASEKRFERGRWAWFAAAGLGMVTYLFASGILVFDYPGSEEDAELEEEIWRDASELDDEDDDEEVVIEVVEEDDA